MYETSANESLTLGRRLIIFSLIELQSESYCFALTLLSFWLLTCSSSCIRLNFLFLKFTGDNDTLKMCLLLYFSCVDNKKDISDLKFFVTGEEGLEFST